MAATNEMTFPVPPCTQDLPCNWDLANGYRWKCCHDFPATFLTARIRQGGWNSGVYFSYEWKQVVGCAARKKERGSVTSGSPCWHGVSSCGLHLHEREITCHLV